MINKFVLQTALSGWLVDKLTTVEEGYKEAILGISFLLLT